MPPILNFSVFVRFQANQVDDVVKLSILDSAMREVTGKQTTIYDLKKLPTML
jgi:hypothetical protein